MDELRDRIDTIFTKDDKFAYTIPVDTITPAFLLINNQIEYPIYLDKGNKIKIKGDISNPEYLHIEGNIYNQEFTAFQEDLRGLGTPSEKVLEQKAEEFIRGHHSSFVSLYLLDKYFVQKDSPDFNKIKKLIEVMAGVLQDKLYIERLNESISQAEKTEIGKYAPFFSLPNVKGEKISRTSENLKKKNLLINFWASWGDSIANQNSNAELREIYKKYKKNKYIAMLGISLDLNKEQWKDAIKRDTLDWEQVCDFDGFNSEVAKQYTIRQIPANILLSADGKILAKDLKGEKLKKKIEEVVSAAEEKDKKERDKIAKPCIVLGTVIGFLVNIVLPLHFYWIPSIVCAVISGIFIWIITALAFQAPAKMAASTSPIEAQHTQATKIS